MFEEGNLFLSEKIVIGSDHGGYKLKKEITKYMEASGYEVCDVGCYSEESCDYPVIAKNAVKEVLAKGYRGILVCGTGIGMSIVANRYEGIRAAHCTDTFSARMTRAHNDSNILCLGERITGTGLALDIVETWLKTAFEGGRHQKRIEMIKRD